MTFVLDRVGVRRGDAVLLDEVSVTIAAGCCTAIVGPSGAGKSTLLRLLNRLIEPTSGRVLYQGVPLPELDVLALRRRVGLVGQRPTLVTGMVLEELRVGRSELPEREARGLLAEAGLPPEFVRRRTAGLSGGEAQRVCLARALALRPGVLLLDEPTSALDPAGAAEVERAVSGLRAEGRTVVLVSHDAVQARRIADEVLVLRTGRLVDQGAPDRVAYLLA